MPAATATTPPAAATPAARPAPRANRAARPDTPAAAFGRLLQRHERAALAVAHAVTADPQRAADAVQEACLLAWRKRSSLADPAAFGAWFLRIVRRCAADQVRRGRLRVPPDLPPPAAGADAAAIRRDRDARLRSAVAALDEATRVAVALRYYDGQPSRRIAEVLACSPAAVDVRLKRARDALRNALGPDFPLDK